MARRLAMWGYTCPICKWYHLTSRKPSRKARGKWAKLVRGAAKPPCGWTYNHETLGYLWICRCGALTPGACKGSRAT